MNPTAALNAYASAARLAGAADKVGSGSAQVADPGSFTNMVKSAIEDVRTTGAAAEAKVADLATGKADLVDVVTAVAETELAIESMVSVRDRVISAYQDLMNMPI